jgi:hypothetical protein
MVISFALKSHGPWAGSALPPDVRRWLCPADSSQIIPGLRSGSGPSPSDIGPEAAVRA